MSISLSLLQCIPTPLAWYFHNLLPKWFHRLSVVATYFIEIPVPFLIFAPIRNLRLFAFGTQMLLQILIVLTGNYSFFNLLTMTLCLSLLDDRVFGKDAAADSSSSSSSSSSKDKRTKPNFLDSISNKLRPFVHPYASVAIYALLFAYLVKFFDLRFRLSSSSSPSSSSSLPFSIESRVAFTEYDFFSSLKAAMPWTIFLGVFAFLIEAAKFVWANLIKLGEKGGLLNGPFELSKVRERFWRVLGSVPRLTT